MDNTIDLELGFGLLLVQPVRPETVTEAGIERTDLANVPLVVSTVLESGGGLQDYDLVGENVLHHPGVLGVEYVLNGQPCHIINGLHTDDKSLGGDVLAILGKDTKVDY